MSGPTGADRAGAAVEQLRLTRVDAHEDLVDVLARGGFKRCDDALPNCDGSGWRGMLTFTADGDTMARRRATVVDVVVPDEYPFAAPRVHPGNRVWAELATGKTLGDEYYEPSRGWHREADLAMCLFDDADHTRLPWADGAALLQQATSWLAADAAGWPDDAPALDLERYLDAAGERRVLLYGPLDNLDGVVRRTRAQRNGVLRLAGPARQHRSGRKSGTRRWGPDAVWIAAAGELTGPIRDWQDLCTAVGPDRAEALTRAHRVGLQRVLLSYTRRGLPAALALELVPGPDRTVELRALPSAPDDNATRAIRAGRDAAALGARRVAVIGVGAVGSVVADLLHRSGVGQVHLIDDDRLLPGNTTRHLLGEAAVGLPKASAAADMLRAARPMHGPVTAQVGALRTAKDAADLLAAFDVVVDATADSTATAMLTAAAGAGAGQLLSVAVLADGHAVRVDRTPVPEGHQPLPEPQLPSPGPTVYEAGCGSPVSTTPPWAVWEAAAIAARHTVGLLTDPGSVPAGEERRLTFLGGGQ
ncbi:ThiF family adenylyltransferase [Blastococcus sp. SYSU DS0753]